MARRKVTRDRYETARRLHEVRTLLETSGGASVYDVMDRFGVARITAIRYVKALQAAGEPLYEEVVDGRKVWRLMPTARAGTMRFTASQVVTLFLARRGLEAFEGTGLTADLDELLERMRATLRRRDFALVKDLERKLFDVGEAAYVAHDRVDDVDEVLSALLKSERLEVRHGSVARGERPFVVEPYTLLVYKKGLYLAGHSVHHGAVRTFALDTLRAARWLRGATFVYPADYHPSQLGGGTFGLVGDGPSVDVTIRFDAEVARYVERRRWHPSQQVRRLEGGDVELSMRLGAKKELLSWILGWGERAEVISPPALRDEVTVAVARMAARYGGRPESGPG